MSKQKVVRELQPTSLPSAPISLMRDAVSLPKNYVEPAWAKDLIEEWKRKEDLFAVDAYPTQSILIKGPSGTGKTTSARWIAQQLRLPLFCLSIATAIDSYMGSTGKNIDSAIQYGLDNPVIVLMDEVDSISASRMQKNSDVGEIWRITNSFIQSLDRWHASPGKSLLIATTNMVDDSIDSAIQRRFELQVLTSLPDEKELSRIAGIPWPSGFQVSQAECRRLVLQAKRRSVMTNASYELVLMALISSLQA